MCDEWKNDFIAFYNLAMENGYEEGLSIDRIDNDLGYSPDNCRFVNAKQQANNRTTNLNYTLNGRTMTLKQWAEEYNAKYHTVYDRVRRGWDIERALTE